MEAVIWTASIGFGVVLVALIVAQLLRAGSGERREYEEEGFDDRP